jgi:large subunit ribosomal protein L19
MQELITKIEDKQKKSRVVDVRSGDVVRVHQRIEEGDKTRTQVFEGLVIRTDRQAMLTSRITVRRIASGVGVEKSFLMHSPLIEKVEVIKRSTVRRKYLSYMRDRVGKSARLAGVAFDKESVNQTVEQQQDAEIIAKAHSNTASKSQVDQTRTDEPTSVKKDKSSSDSTEEIKQTSPPVVDKDSAET